MKNVIKRAKAWNNAPTEYNRVQFLEAFNALDEAEQVKAVAPGSELSGILLGWSVATRLELSEAQ